MITSSNSLSRGSGMPNQVDGAFVRAPCPVPSCPACEPNSGSVLPSLSSKATRVEGADIVMQSCRVLARNMSGYATNRELRRSHSSLFAAIVAALLAGRSVGAHRRYWHFVAHQVRETAIALWRMPDHEMYLIYCCLRIQSKFKLNGALWTQAGICWPMLGIASIGGLQNNLRCSHRG